MTPLEKAILKRTYYSNGKLLITGEYVVLDGATAFALPTKFGQYLHVEEGHNNSIRWISKDTDGSLWLDLDIPFEAVIQKTLKGGQAEYDTLVDILHEAYKINPDTLDTAKGFSVTTELTFPRQWGLGTSSTLINNIAQWFAVDAFKLLENSFGGSGYDIACAQNNTPLLYHLEDRKPSVEAITFDPLFKDNLYFVYLNKKQSSKSAIASYKAKRNNIAETLNIINSITHKVIYAEDYSTFCSALEEHEKIMSKILEIPTAKETIFPGFNGSIKSLGAWGGDFILAAATEDPTAYFEQVGYSVVIPYHRMILK